MYNINKDSNEPTIKEAACDMGDKLHDSANKAGHKVRSMIQHAGADISNAKEHVTGEIRNNPVRSSVIALGVGMLLAVILRK